MTHPTKCPHCGGALSPPHPPYPRGTIPERLPGEASAAANERNLRRVLETGFGTSGFTEQNFTYQAAQRLIANEVPLSEIEAALAAWNSGKRIPGIEKTAIFQKRHWPTVRAALLGDDAPAAAPSMFDDYILKTKIE